MTCTPQSSVPRCGASFPGPAAYVPSILSPPQTTNVVVRLASPADSKGRTWLQVLNAILDHAGLPQLRNFSEAEVNSTKGFQGQEQPLTKHQRIAYASVRAALAPQIRDFNVLMSSFFPHLNVTFPFEYVE
jgi:hypothetical protein